MSSSFESANVPDALTEGDLSNQQQVPALPAETIAVASDDGNDDEMGENIPGMGSFQTDPLQSQAQSQDPSQFQAVPQAQDHPQAPLPSQSQGASLALPNTGKNTHAFGLDNSNKPARGHSQQRLNNHRGGPSNLSGGVEGIFPVSSSSRGRNAHAHAHFDQPQDGNESDESSQISFNTRDEDDGYGDSLLYEGSSHGRYSQRGGDDEEDPAFTNSHHHLEISEGHLVGYLRVGTGMKFICQVGPKRCGQYRLFSSSVNFEWKAAIEKDKRKRSTEKMYFDASDQSLRKLKAPGSCRTYRGIAGVAYETGESMDPDQERMPRTLLKIAWTDSPSTWETRTDFRSIRGKKHADQEIFDAVEHYQDLWDNFQKSDTSWNPNSRARSETPGYDPNRARQQTPRYASQPPQTPQQTPRYASQPPQTPQHPQVSQPRSRNVSQPPQPPQNSRTPQNSQTAQLRSKNVLQPPQARRDQDSRNFAPQTNLEQFQRQNQRGFTPQANQYQTQRQQASEVYDHFTNDPNQGWQTSGYPQPQPHNQYNNQSVNYDAGPPYYGNTWEGSSTPGYVPGFRQS